MGWRSSVGFRPRLRNGDAGPARGRLLGLSPARAVEAVNVRTDAPAIDLTDAIERHRTDSDRIQVSTAPGPDGIVRRIDVRAREGNTNWAVFALANTSDEQIDRLIVVPHYRMVGSGLFWPDLGRSRIASITPSGERPDRQDSATADIFRITLDPGSVITFVPSCAPTSSAALSVGAGRLQGQGQLLHALPRHRHRHRRPAGAVPDHPVRREGLRSCSRPPPRSAGRCWSISASISASGARCSRCRRTPSRSGAPRARRSWRRPWSCSCSPISTSTAGTCATPTSRIGWLVFLALLVALALFDPPIASGIARISLLAVAMLGFALVVYLSTHGFDRAVLLIPTWLLLLVWVIAAGARGHGRAHQRHRRRRRCSAASC